MDPAGNNYIATTFGGTADFNPGAAVTNLVAAGAKDVGIAKLDINGNFVWAKRIGTDGSRSDGLRMKALPAAIAGPNFHIGIIAGKLKGVMPATTPSG